MPKNKRPVPRKSTPSPEEQEAALTASLAKLAAELARQNAIYSPDSLLPGLANDFQKIIKKCLHQKKDDVLYQALEQAQEAEPGAYLLLKEHIEETAQTVLFHRETGPAQEINAFVIPLFVHSNGGLRQEQSFQDQEAFDLLTKSLQAAQLESRDATVVLVSHAYHLDEIDRICYSHLNDMVREAFAAMTSKKTVATPALDRSISGWPVNHFAAQDLAVELRFLLGFSLKATDDPFYQVPENEAAADRYFDARAARFQQWAQQAADLVKRCLVTDQRAVEIHFLYQDLFYGGKQRGMAEYYLLDMMAELHDGLQRQGQLPENTQAIIGPTDIGDDMVLRVNLVTQADGSLVASAEKPLDAAFDLDSEAFDVCDALMTIGVTSVSLARAFDEEGQPVGARPYVPAAPA